MIGPVISLKSPRRKSRGDIFRQTLHLLERVIFGPVSTPKEVSEEKGRLIGGLK